MTPCAANTRSTSGRTASQVLWVKVRTSAMEWLVSIKSGGARQRSMRDVGAIVAALESDRRHRLIDARPRLE